MNMQTNRLNPGKRATVVRVAENEHISCYEFYNFEEIPLNT